MLLRLSGLGWPVACPIDDPLVIAGRLYALFPFIGGAPMNGAPDDKRRRCGRLLAELHAEVGTLAIEQRPGVGAIADFDAAELLSTLGEARSVIDRELADAIGHHANGAASMLDRLGARDFPRGLVHRDFQPWNLRFSKGTLTAIYDFDPASIDAFALDVASTRRGYHDVAVDGYLDARSLANDELAVLPSLWVASTLWYAGFVLRESTRTGVPHVSELEWCRGARTKPSRTPEHQSVVPPYRGSTDGCSRYWGASRSSGVWVTPKSEMLGKSSGLEGVLHDLAGLRCRAGCRGTPRTSAP